MRLFSSTDGKRKKKCSLDIGQHSVSKDHIFKCTYTQLQCIGALERRERACHLSALEQKDDTSTGIK